MKASRAGACSMENQTVARSGLSPVASGLEKPLLAGYMSYSISETSEMSDFLAKSAYPGLRNLWLFQSLKA